MTAARSGLTASEWLWTLTVMALLGAAFAATQSWIPDDVAHDGGYYLKIARQIQQGLPPETINPFVLRVGTPWLAAALSDVSRLSLSGAFFLVNVSASAIAAVLFAVWLRGHVADGVTRLVLLVFFLVSPYSSFRWSFYYPTLTDAAAVLFLMLGLIALDRLSRRIDAAASLTLTAIVAVGCLFRELVLVAAVAALFVRPWSMRPIELVWRVVPLAGAATLAAVQSWVIVTPSGYSMADAVRRWLEWKTVSMMALAVLFVFGPLVVLPAIRWRQTVADALARPDLLVFTATFLAAGWLGASDSERIMVFAVPVVLMQIGKTLADLRGSGARVEVAAIIAFQLLAYRIVLPIASLASPFFFEHFSFFSVWLDAMARWLFLACYAVLIGLTVAFVRSARLPAEIPSAAGRIHV